MNEWSHSNDHRYHQGYPPGYPHDQRHLAPRKRKWIAGLLAFFLPGTGHFYLGQMVKGIAVMLLLAADICAIVFAATQLNNVLVIVLLSLLMPIIYFYNLFDAIQSTDIVNDRLRYSGWHAPTYGMPGSSIPNPAGQAAGYAERPAEFPSPETMEPSPVPPGPSPVPPGPMPISEGTHRGINATGIVLLAAGAIVLLLATDIGWTHWMFRSSSSMAGAIVLIGAGVGLWIWEMRNDRGRKG